MNIYDEIEEPKEPDYPLFVRWTGGPSIWLHVNGRWVLLEELLENSHRSLNQDQRRKIGLLANNVMRRESSTTYPTNPIRLSRGEVEKLLEILDTNDEDLCAIFMLEAVGP